MKIEEVNEVPGDDRLADVSRKVVEAVDKALPDNPGGVRAIIFVYDPKTDKANFVLGNYQGEEQALMDIERMPDAVKGINGF
jgi:hypothetical protein